MAARKKAVPCTFTYNPPAPLDEKRIQKLPHYQQTIEREIAEEGRKASEHGLAQLQKENTLSAKALQRKIREETLRVRLSERLPVQLWKRLRTEVRDGTYWLVEECSTSFICDTRGSSSANNTYATEQAQAIPLREWWYRQLKGA